MAQLVERTLGKGEVPSSILGISTSEPTCSNSLIYQRISYYSNQNNFSKKISDFYAFGIPKPFFNSDFAQNTLSITNTVKNHENISRIERVLLRNSVGELSVIGILYKEQLNSKLSPTLKLFLSILTNLCKNSSSNFIDYSNLELVSKIHGLFSLVQIRRHIDKLSKLGLISIAYGENSSRKIFITCVNDFSGKYLSLSSLYTESGASKLNASQILVFSYLLDRSSFFAKADLVFFADSEDAALICKELNISDRTLRNAYASLIELKAVAYCSDASKKAVKAVNISEDISSQYAKKFNITSSEHCRKIVLKRCKSFSPKSDVSSLTNDALKSLLLSLKTKKKLGKKCRSPQGAFGKKGSFNASPLEKNDLSINNELNDLINNEYINAQHAVSDTYKLNLKNDPIGIRFIPPLSTQNSSSFWLLQIKPGSHAERDLKLCSRELSVLHKINGIDLKDSKLSESDLIRLVNQKSVNLQISSFAGIYQNSARRNFELTRNI